MAVQLMTKENKVFVDLNNGTKSGIVQTIPVSLGTLSNDNFDPEKVLRVATEFPNIARKYYAELGREIDIIPLRGSLELAPVLGLSDVIVDIVETGTTLRENNLHVVSYFADLSARLIANKSAYKFKKDIIAEIMRRLSDND